MEKKNITLSSWLVLCQDDLTDMIDGLCSVKKKEGSASLESKNAAELEKSDDFDRKKA